MTHLSEDTTLGRSSCDGLSHLSEIAWPDLGAKSLKPENLLVEASWHGHLLVQV